MEISLGYKDLEQIQRLLQTLAVRHSNVDLL